MIPETLFAFVIATLIYYGHKIMYMYKRPNTKPIPGPTFWEGIRTLIPALRNNTLHIAAEKWAKQYGDLVEVNTGFSKIIFVNNEKLARQLLCDPESRDATNDRPPTFVGKYVMENCQDLITASYDAGFVKRRKLFHNALKFYGDGVQTFEVLMQESTQGLVNRMGKQEGNVALSEALTDHLCRIVCLLLKGKHLVDSDLGLMVNFLDKMNTCFRFENDTILQLAPFLRFIPGLPFKKLNDDVMFYRSQLADNFFWKVRELYEKGDKSGITAELLELQKNLKGAADKDNSLSDQLILGLIQDIAGAGYLSTASAANILFLLLIKEQTIQDRIFEEIQTVIGDAVPSFEHRRRMPYTEAAIIELLRYSTIAPFMVPHFVNRNLTVNGCIISKGSTLLLNSWYIHHREDNWPEPWLFRPERFLDSDGQLLDPEHPERRKEMTFGTGRRMCPGENFARSRLFLIVVTLLQHFRFVAPSGSELPSSHPKDWEPKIAICPDSYQCKVELRV